MSGRGGTVGALGRAIRTRRVPRSTIELYRDDAIDTVASLTGRRSATDGTADDDAPPFPIDIVYTWVDHGDAAWSAEFHDHVTARRDRPADAAATHRSRFENHDELRYSMRSIHRYAPWAGTIHVVTAGSSPHWLAPHPRVRVVPHAEILPADALPTFNSHAIESRLHRIEGLSERYVYMNDDFFLARSQGYRRYFSPDGRPQVPVSSTPVATVPVSAVGMYAASHRTNEIVERLTSRPADRLLHHAPYPQTRSVVTDLERIIGDELDTTATRRVRHVDDVSVPASLAPWYALATGRADVATVVTEYVSVGHPTTAARLRRLRRRRSFDSFCLNWTEHTGRGWDRRVARFLEARFPDPAPWER